MTGAGEGSRRGLGTRGKGSLVVPGARSKAGLLWGTERLRGLSERWKAPSSHPLREKPAEETSTVEEASPRLASVSALAQPLPGYPARPRAGRGDGQPRRNPAPSGFFFFCSCSALSATPGPPQSHFCRGSGSNWQGGPRAGASELNLAVCWYLAHTGAWVCSFTFLSQATLLSLRFYQGPRLWSPLWARVHVWESAETPAPPPCHLRWSAALERTSRCRRRELSS